MTLKQHLKSLLGWLAVGLCCLPQPVQACAVCFGQTDSKMARGLIAGVSVLLLVVLGVLTCFGALFMHIKKRAATVAVPIKPPHTFQ